MRKLSKKSLNSLKCSSKSHLFICISAGRSSRQISGKVYQQFNLSLRHITTQNISLHEWSKFVIWLLNCLTSKSSVVLSIRKYFYLSSLKILRIVKIYLLCSRLPECLRKPKGEEFMWLVNAHSIWPYTN